MIERDMEDPLANLPGQDMFTRMEDLRIAA